MNLNISNFIYFALCLAISSCSDKFTLERQARTEVVIPHSNNTASESKSEPDVRFPLDKCQLEFLNGENAPLDLPKPEMWESFFSKKYDASLLNSVLSASGKEFVRFANLAGVKFYKFVDQQEDSQINGCTLGKQLPIAPDAVQTLFAQSEKSGPMPWDKSITLGLYIDISGLAKVGLKSEVAVIAMRSRADRYVMLHEFMHHMFKREEIFAPETEKNQYEAYSKLYSDSVNKFNSDRNAENLKVLLFAYQARSNSLMSVLKSYYLEEIAIETELNRLYENGQLKNIQPNDRLNGDYYIKRSSDKAKRLMVSHKTPLKTVEKYIEQVSLSETELEYALSLTSEIEDRFLKTTHLIDQLLIEPVKRISQNEKSNNIQEKISSSIALDLYSKKCNHNHSIDQFFEYIEAKTPLLK